MADRAPGREATDNEPPCYNCGMRGHLFNACPEPARKIPAGLEASRARQQSRNNNGYDSFASKRHKGPIITRYPVPMDNGSQYPHGPPPPGYPPYSGADVALHSAQSMPFDPYRTHGAPGIPGPPGLSGPAHPYGTPPFGQPTSYNSSYPYSGFSGPPGPLGPLGPPPQLPTPGPPGPPGPPVHYYAGPPQHYPPPPPYQQQAPAYGSPRPPPGYNEPYYQPPSHTSPPPHHSYYPPGEPQNHSYAGERGQIQYMHDYPRRQDDRPIGQQWNGHGPSDSSYVSNGPQPRPYRYRDERPQGQGDRKGRRQQNRYDQRPKNERPHRNYDRRRDYYSPVKSDNPRYEESRSITGSPRSRITGGRTDKTGQSQTQDLHIESDEYEPIIELDNSADDPVWEEKMIFKDPPPRIASEIPIATPLPADWVDEISHPTLATAVTVESRYVTASNVDDFSQSVRDTKEWSFMQYHPALLEVGDAHMQMLNRYHSALKSWNSQHQNINKKAHNSKRYKGKNDSNKYHSKPYDVNGYHNKSRGNARYPKQPHYESIHANWDETAQPIGVLPEITGHYGVPDIHGLRSTQYATERLSTERLSTERVNGDDREFGHEYYDAERDYRHKPDTRGKRRWAEFQGGPNTFQTQTFDSQSRYENNQRSSKRSKYVSPEPGEISEGSDRIYDRPSDAFTPSHHESFPEDHQYPFNSGRGNYAQRASTKLHEVIENSKEKHTIGRVTTPAISVDDASAAESGEVVETDVQSPRRNDFHTIRDTDDIASWYVGTRKSPQLGETSERRNPKDPIHRSVDGLPSHHYKVTSWDDNDIPPTPPGQPSPHSRPSSRRSSKGPWGGSRRNSGQNSRRSSFDDAHVESPLTPTELALLGLDRPSTSGSDTGRESPKRQLDDVTPKLKSRRAKVHEAYSRRW